MKEEMLLLKERTMQNVTSTFQKYRFERSKSEDEFIQTNNLDFRHPQDSHVYLIYLLEKIMSHQANSLPNIANFNGRTCLEHCLDKRATEYQLDDVDNVKLILAVSGAGKTRMLLELLYSNFGYYFTAKSSVKDFGSADLGKCRAYCDRNPEEAERAIQLMYYIRVSVCNYLISKGFQDTQTILLAQLHPSAFFGSDVFELLFTALVKEPTFNMTQIVNPFPFVAIDEIQVTLEGTSRHLLPESGTNRPFFSPLVHYSKKLGLFPNFLLSGTGINFKFVKGAMESGTMKRNLVTAYQVISDFRPLSKSQVESYANRFLKYHKVAEIDEIVSRIAAFELCHGRPRFVAYILDGYLESRDIELSIGEFVAGVTSVDSQMFPLRFIKRDLDNNMNPFDRNISNSTLGDIIRSGLLSLIITGKLVFSVGDQMGALAIQSGLGFGRVTEGILGGIEINELAVLECLRFFVPFSELVKSFAKQMSTCPQPQMVGYLLEYLVAFALVANYSAQDDEALCKINVSQRFPHEYLQFGDASQVCFPDHMCGPDIIYKCPNKNEKGGIVYIVQVKFVKRLTKQEIANACDTTDHSKFYCKRTLKEGESGDVVLDKFRERRTKLLEALTDLQKKQGYSIQQLLFIHTGGSTSDFTHGATIINSVNNPKFFDKIGPGLWEFLDSLREKF